MDIWNTGKSFKNGSAPAPLTSFSYPFPKFVFYIVCSVGAEAYCLPLLDNHSLSLFLEAVPIASFCLLLGRHAPFIVWCLTLALFCHCEVRGGG